MKDITDGDYNHAKKINMFEATQYCWPVYLKIFKISPLK